MSLFSVLKKCKNTDFTVKTGIFKLIFCVGDTPHKIKLSE